MGLVIAMGWHVDAALWVQRELPLPKRFTVSSKQLICQVEQIGRDRSLRLVPGTAEDELRAVRTDGWERVAIVVAVGD